jgi:hypothetical protein
MEEKQSTPRPEAYEDDLIPNALIFLQENWREKAHNLRLRDYSQPKASGYSSYQIGYIEKYE